MIWVRILKHIYLQHILINHWETQKVPFFFRWNLKKTYKIY